MIWYALHKHRAQFIELVKTWDYGTEPCPLNFSSYKEGNKVRKKQNPVPRPDFQPIKTYQNTTGGLE